MSTKRQAGLATIVLVSGEGTNLQALIDAERAGRIRTELRAVFSDRADVPALQRAKAAGIAAHYQGAQEYSARADYDRALAAQLAQYAPELLVLAGFTRILSAGFVSLFDGRMLNIHPSLLPRFRGLDTHRRVLEAGDDFHGATVHFVTEALDAGPRVIQYRIPVHPDDDEASLSARVHRGEYIILPRAVGWYADGRLRLEQGNVMLDGQELTSPVVVEEEQ